MLPSSTETIVREPAPALQIEIPQPPPTGNGGLEAKELLSAIIESSDDAIISKDLNGIITSWNKGAERIFGYSASEVIGKPVTILIPPDRQDEEPVILRRIRNGERIEHYETIRRRKDGTLLHISLSVSPVRDRHGKVLGASKIARDISARKQAEAALQAVRGELARLNAELENRVKTRTAALEEAIAQMEEFSYSVSHDLRAPVRTMKRYAEIAREQFGNELRPEARHYLQKIIEGGERMDRLIQDVLNYSQISRRQIVLESVDLEKLISGIVQAFPEMQAPRAFITVQTPLSPVLAYEPLLTQAVVNLLTNAVKFVRPDTTPRLSIKTEARASRIRLWIEDNGIGIKPQYQHRVFGLFERLQTDSHYEGTGIGLPIVRRAVDKMGGTAGLESDGFSGCRFWIELSRPQISSTP